MSDKMKEVILVQTPLAVNKPVFKISFKLCQFPFLTTI